MKQSYVQVYTGNGKGKTTAAAGLAVRAAAAGLSVKFVQLLKGRKSGEVTALAAMDGVEVLRAADSKKFFYELNGEEQRRMRSEVVEALRTIRSFLGQADVIVIDEALGALDVGILTRDEVTGIIDNRGGSEIVLTGRDAPKWLINAADLVTEMRDVKHYMDAGVDMRKGIEY